MLFYIFRLGEPCIVFNFTGTDDSPFEVGVEISNCGTIFVTRYEAGEVEVISPE